MRDIPGGGGGGGVESTASGEGQGYQDVVEVGTAPSQGKRDSSGNTGTHSQLQVGEIVELRCSLAAPNRVHSNQRAGIKINPFPAPRNQADLREMLAARRLQRYNNHVAISK